MPADIRTIIVRGVTTVFDAVNTSPDILRKGDVVTCSCTHIDQTSYAWSLSFIPVSSNGTVSSATLSTPTAISTSFTADFDGSYLVQLTVNEGAAGEDTQYVRVRGGTKFADIKMVAAGESYNTESIIPVDATEDGWASQMNLNIQRVLAISRRSATTGRILWVDANRPKGFKGVGLEDKSDNPANDPTKSVLYPGTDQTSTVTNAQTGIEMATEAVADFGTVQAAIDYAADAVSRGEEEPSLQNPFWIKIQPGLYIEDLDLKPHIHLIADTTLEAAEFMLSGVSLTGDLTGIPRLNTVAIQTATAVGHTLSAPNVPPTTDHAALVAFLTNFPTVALHGITLENWIADATPYPALTVTGSVYLYANGSSISQVSSALGQPGGPAILFSNVSHLVPDQRDFVVATFNRCLLARGFDVGGPPSQPVIMLDSAGQYSFSQFNEFLGGSVTLQIPDAAAVGETTPKAKETFITVSGFTKTATTQSVFFRGFPGTLTLSNTDITGDLELESDLADGTVPFSPLVTVENSTYSGYLKIDDDKLSGSTTRVIWNNVVGPLDYSSIVMEAAPARVSTVFHGNQVTSQSYLNGYVPPERGVAGTPVITDTKQAIPKLGTDNVPLRNLQNLLDIFVQMAVPDAPPTDITDPDYDVNRTYTPTLNAAYDGIFKMDTNPVRGEGLGRRIYVKQVDGVDKPVQVTPDDTGATHLFRVGASTPDVNQYVDLGCDTHGVLKVYGTISSQNNIQYAQVRPLTPSGGGADAWPGDLAGGETETRIGGGLYPVTATRLIYGVVYEITDPGNPTFYMPQSSGTYGTDSQYPQEGQIITIKDESGTAAGNNITIKRTVDSSAAAPRATAVEFENTGADFVMTTNFQSVSFYYHLDPVTSTGHWYEIV